MLIARHCGFTLVRDRDLAEDEDAFDKFILKALDVDPDARDDDFLLRARSVTAWETCKMQYQVEVKSMAERAARGQLGPMRKLHGDRGSSWSSIEDLLE